MRINTILLTHSKSILAVFALLLVSIGFFSRLFYPGLSIFATAEIGINDIWYFNYPMKEILHKSLSTGKIPLWSNLIGGGFPIFAEGQIGTLNVYNLIAFALLPTIYAYTIGYIVIFFQCALGMYLFARSQHFSEIISWFMALLFSFSGFFITHISHFALLQTASYFPLLLYAAHLVVTCRRARMATLAFACILSQQIFAGSPQIVFISLIAVLFYSFYTLYSKKSSSSRLMLLFFSVFFGLILSAGQILPTAQLTRVSQRSTGLSTRELTFYKYPPQHFLTFLFPFFYGNPQLGTYPHFNKFQGSLFWENTGYIGIIPIVLALIAIVLYSRHRFPWVYGGFLLFFGLLMLGGAGPLYILLTFPPFSYFRFSSRYLLVFVFSLVMVAGYGMTNVLTWFNKRARMRTIVQASIIILSLFDIGIVWWRYHPVVPFDAFRANPPSVTFLQGAPHGSIYTYAENTRAYNEFFSSGSGKSNRYLDLRNELTPNINAIFSVPTTKAYTALYPKRLAYLYGELGSFQSTATQSAILTRHVMGLLNIRNTTHILSGVPLLNPQFRELVRLPLPALEGEQKLYIYENQEALPKYYAVTKYRVVTTLEEAVDVFDAPDFQQNTQVLIEKSRPAFENEKPLDVSVSPIWEKDGDIKLTTRSNQDSIFSLAVSYYPGWIATIDGTVTNIFPVNLVNMGIDLPKGSHTVRIRFEPKSFGDGMKVTVIGYGIVFLAGIYFLRRHQ